MVRRPFASLLAVAGLALVLAGALLVVTFPHPLQSAMARCVQAGGFCLQLLMVGRAAGSPLLVLVLLGVLGWSLWRGWCAGWRQWRATNTALSRLRALGLHTPDPNLQRLCAELGLVDRVDVLAYSRPLALCHGLLRPRIWLSTGTLALLRSAELAAVLRHERAHQRGRHPLQLLLARSLAAALPFLPVLRELAAMLPLAQELAADRAVLREQSRVDLGRALLALSLQDGTDAPPLATGMAGMLDIRLDQLTGTPIAPPSLSPGALARTLLVLGAGSVLLVIGILVQESTQLAASSFAPATLTGSWRCLLVFAVLGRAWHRIVRVFRSA